MVISFRLPLKLFYPNITLILIFFWFFFEFSGIALALTENFNGDYNLSSSWVVDRANNTSFSENSLTLKAFDNYSYPFIRTSANIFNDSGYYKTVFRYNSVGGFGSGIAFTDTLPSLNTVMTYPDNFIKYAPIYLWQNNSQPYLHVVTSLCSYGVSCIETPKIIYSTLTTDNNWHTFEIIRNNNSYKLLLDDNSLGEFSIGQRNIRFVWIGHPEITNTPNSWSELEIDLISNDQEFFIPYLSQKDGLWGGIEYDAASSWAGSEKNTIARWGCAITSTAMVLRGNEIKMPTGTLVTPDRLNEWLKSEPDGYVGNGLLNWLAVTRLARLSRAAGHSPTDLEFIKSTGSPGEEIALGYHPIINEGGHFVTAYGEEGDDYQILDPNDENRLTLPKTKSLTSINTFIPSNTDLSYLLFVTDTEASISARHNGVAVGSVAYDEYLSDDLATGSSPPSRLYYLPKPAAGEYILEVDNAGSGASNIMIYAYDYDGDVATAAASIAGAKSSYSLSYDPTGVAAPSISLRDTTPPAYTGTNSFGGDWYNQPQKAHFYFEDENLASEFVNPTCEIVTEGKAQRCSLEEVVVCDKLANCATHRLVSNPANIDLTPPPSPKLMWGFPGRPWSLVIWQTPRDGVLTKIEWGSDKTNLSNSLTTKHQHAWLPTPKKTKYYYRLQFVDRAGNASAYSAVKILAL